MKKNKMKKFLIKAPLLLSIIAASKIATTQETTTKETKKRNIKSAYKQPKVKLSARTLDGKEITSEPLKAGEKPRPVITKKTSNSITVEIPVVGSSN
ncbi:MAG: hypothetical protein OIF36_00265 [Alphaproteobacteria bacterium]|jgi:hypothetical protein|nr:hypothetical protein [Alphaproteobacteria bacterium]MCV6598905.1 hypothetical protein [Alphaproteobacteria bacterium]